MFLMGDDIPKDKVWDLEEHKDKRKRSLDSNSYFHVIVHKLAQAMNPPVSMAKCKNMMIAAYGQPEYINGTQVIIKSNLPEETMSEIEYLHTSCVKITEENGNQVYFYRVYRGSHTYSVQEMQKLISGVVQECQQVGVETATPDEIAHMQVLWETKYAKRNSEHSNG
jgi:hypothetical protein